MDQASPSADIKQLRRRARALGISIRTKRASKSRPTPAYDLIETASGRLLSGGLSRLVDIEEHLESAAVDRRDGDARGEVCPACATPRVAFFRWCQSCGRDFEAFKTESAALDESHRRPDPAPDRFCESCGKDQSLSADGPLTRTPDGAYLCRSCAQRRATADQRPLPVVRTRPAFIPPAKRRRPIRRPGTWAVIAATIGLLAVVATQLPRLQQPAGGGVLGETATGDVKAPESTGDRSISPVSRSPSAGSPSVAPEPTGAGSPAGEASVTVGEGTVTTWTGAFGEARIQVIVPVRNTTASWVGLPRSASRFRVVDGGGRELASGLFTVALPGVIGPDQTAYLVETVSASFVAGTGTPKVEATVEAAPVDEPATSLQVTDLQAEAGPDGGLRLKGTVENKGPAPADALIAGGVLLDAQRRPVGAVYDPGLAGPVAAGASVPFETAYPGAPPPPDGDATLVGFAFEANDDLGE
jgi:hypothetical protein